MEGSRHERAAIVTTAYVIGFATAFIAFGVTQINLPTEIVYVPTESGMASVVAAAAKPVTLTVNETGLVLEHKGSQTLISATNETGGTDGIAASITQYELSPDQKFAYFCELPVADAEACKPFVYDIAHETVVPLTQNGERIALPAAPATIVWNETGITTIDTITVDPLPMF